METMETLETRGNMEGNTKIPRVVPGRYWCFTWNNYEKNSLETLETKFNELGIKYVIGKEIGENGTKHLQGYIDSPNKIRPIEKIKIKEIHWEKCKGNKEQNIEYCSKGNDVVSNIRLIKDVIKEKGAFDWQKEIIELCEQEPDPRKIYWYWDKNGNKGKTELAKHLCLKYKGKALFVNGKAADVKCAIAQMENKPEIIIFGVPRTSEQYMSYAALEEVKDGIFFSGKYESGMVIYPTPHVFVFCNFSPDTSALSEDRWVIKNIGNELKEDILWKEYLADIESEDEESS